MIPLNHFIILFHYMGFRFGKVINHQNGQNIQRKSRQNFVNPRAEQMCRKGAVKTVMEQLGVWNGVPGGFLRQALGRRLKVH